MRLLITALVIGALAPSAHAGLECGPKEREQFLRALEQYVKGPADMESILEGYQCQWLHGADESYTQRYLQACTAVLARRGAEASVKTQCAKVALAAGKTVLGKVDLFTVFRESDLDPVDDEAPGYLAAMAASGDPRARTVILELFRKYLARAALKPPRGYFHVQSWVKWQVATLATLEKVATPEDRGFVDAVTASTKEPKVLAAAARLAAVLDARKGP